MRHIILEYGVATRNNIIDHTHTLIMAYKILELSNELITAAIFLYLTRRYEIFIQQPTSILEALVNIQRKRDSIVKHRIDESSEIKAMKIHSI